MRTIELRAPGDAGRILAELAPDGDAQISAAALASARAQSRWVQVPIAGRVDFLARFAEGLRRAASTLSLQMAEEIGKPVTMAASIPSPDASCNTAGLTNAGWSKPVAPGIRNIPKSRFESGWSCCSCVANSGSAEAVRS